MSEQFKERMSAAALPVNGDALQGARRESKDVSPEAPLPPGVTAMAQRRQFSAADRAMIVSAVDEYEQPGNIGILMRCEGIYSSLLSDVAYPTQHSTAPGT